MKKLLILALLFWGCDSPTDNNETNSIIGSWNAIEIRRTNNLEGFMNLTDENYYYKFLFNQDSSMFALNCDLDGTTTASTGTWKVSNSNQIIITNTYTEAGNDFSYSYYFILNNNSLILSTIENYEHGVTDGMYFICQKEE